MAQATSQVTVIFAHGYVVAADVLWDFSPNDDFVFGLDECGRSARGWVERSKLETLRSVKLSIHNRKHALTCTGKTRILVWVHEI